MGSTAQTRWPVPPAEAGFGVPSAGDPRRDDFLKGGSARARSYGRRVVVGSVALLSTLGLTGSLLWTLSSSNDADAAVVSAIKSTLSDQTAQLVESGSVTIGNETIKLSGSGLEDF